MKTALLMLVAGIAPMACSPSNPPAQTAGMETTTPALPQSATTPPVTPPSGDAPTPPTSTIPTDPNADACNKAQYAALIGKPATDPGVPAAGRTVRLIHPGDKVTMDFSPTRLNVDIDDKGVITGLRCG